jgi:isopropylmalate/homocitrate/citramalate synthase
MNLSKFRNLMAENGLEYTPAEALEIYKGVKKIIKKAKAMSQKDFWELQDQQFEGVSEKEKNEIIELYKKAKEIWM